MDEPELLLHLYKTAKSAKESQRYHAVLLVKTGTSMTQVARLFFVDIDTIRLWVHKWNQEKKTSDSPRSGRPRILTPEQEKEVSEIVDENNPAKEGYDVASWDCRELKILIQDRYRTDLSVEAIRRMLRHHGFSYRKAEYLFLKRDEQQRQQFIAQTLDLTESNVTNTLLLFGDEMSTKLHPKQGYVWTRNGSVLIETNCSHKRINTIGAVDPLRGKVTIEQYDKNNTQSFILFLQKLLETYSENIVLVLDNYPVHHSKKVKEFLEQNSRLALKFLPTYSPDLNPIEWLWGYLRKKFLNGKVHQSTDALIQTLKRAVEVIKPEKIKEICTLKVMERYRTI